MKKMIAPAIVEAVAKRMEEGERYPEARRAVGVRKYHLKELRLALEERGVAFRGPKPLTLSPEEEAVRYCEFYDRNHGEGAAERFKRRCEEASLKTVSEEKGISRERVRQLYGKMTGAKSKPRPPWKFTSKIERDALASAAKSCPSTKAVARRLRCAVDTLKRAAAGYGIALPNGNLWQQRSARRRWQHMRRLRRRGWQWKRIARHCGTSSKAAQVTNWYHRHKRASRRV